MDVFQLRQQIIDQYAAYTRSFLTILDPAISSFVDDELERGRLWPDSLVQLSPAYLQSGTVADLAKEGVLHPTCAAIFRTGAGDAARSLQLYHHQRRAIELAAKRKHFVVTTGTGSGKSLTYMLPIIDHVLRHQPEAGKVRAIIVYPMNALINSQAKALERFLANLPAEGRSVTFARYTGQENDARKREIQERPPHILLTNYVMLELMLTRPREFAFVDRGAADLQFIVLDELHTYRGRQGADVGLLLRRVRERSGNPNLLCIGTSATMSSGAQAAERQAAVARVASTIFGVELLPDQVIEEMLDYAVPAFNTPTASDLRAALLRPLPEALDWSTFQQHPLAFWIERTFSLDSSGESLRRARPRTLQTGAAQLADETGVSIEICAEQLARFFQLGSAVRSADDRPGFAFKLHQFLSQGSAVYSTLELPPARHLTLEGQRYIGGAAGERLLFPLVFCRECGQHYALCAYHAKERRVEPRGPMSRGDDVGEEARAGYLLLGEGTWSEEDEELLPDSWFNITRTKRSLKKEYREFRPQQLFVAPDGQLRGQAAEGTTAAWFIPTPFMTCLCCGVVYTKRDKDDFRKLARLSSEGRSTATTLVSVAAVDGMHQSDLPAASRKLLSFTDNRQDASLQAGHMNDFAGVSLLRAAIAAALAAQPAVTPLSYLTVAPAVFRALNLPQAAYAKEIGTYSAQRRNEEALTALLEYRIYEDLRRSWRITQPNLEQCGLLTVDYQDLAAICADDKLWAGHPVLAACSPAQRERTIRLMLNHMRSELAVDAPCLDPARQPDMVRLVNSKLDKASRWAFADEEARDLRAATLVVVPSEEPLPTAARSFSVRGALGRFLRSPEAWPALSAKLDEAAYEQLLTALLELLQQTGLLVNVAEKGPRAVQIRHDALLWHAGDGSAPPPDPIRSRRMGGKLPAQRQPNRFFHDFYRQPLASLRTLEGREHTGQVRQEDREAREEQFRNGDLPVLFCSPTMELGIDIADLAMVHMRNVPPTPANYAQRSGRAGRSGQPALVMTYCSTGSGHDQYFFQRPERMVAGVVAPPQIELANEDLVRSHVHAIWLAFAAIDLSSEMLSIVDTSRAGFPLHDDVLARVQLDAPQLAACLATCQRVLASLRSDLASARWFGDDQLQAWLQAAPQAFDAACDRWRRLFADATAQLSEARAMIDRSHQRKLPPKETDEAKQRQAEAMRQLSLLCNNGERGQSESDFYPYRYFASEGFLPGYNFPRLPVRAYLPLDRDDGSYLTRPRFLAISEFGPQNIIYHEGRKFRISRAQLPASGAAQLFRKAKICKVCGAFYEQADVDLCAQCGTSLDSGTAQLLPALFEMTTAVAQRVDRITCEEEERARTGFVITSHYQFAKDRRADATVDLGGSAPLLLQYGHTATIWRVNHGWRRARQPGFALDLQKGRWGRQPGGDDLGEGDDLSGSTVQSGISLLVRDTRNMLLLVPPPAVSADAEQLTSLQYALLRGIEATFQLEEQELSAELLGSGSSARIMLWEAAEGGAGVLRRLVEEPDALARVARAALAIGHFDPDSGAEQADAVGECVRACYRCLLSYANQPAHALLNRHAVRDLLLALSRASVEPQQPKRSASAPVAADLPADLPPATARVLAFVRANGGREPEAILTEVLGQRPHLAFSASHMLLCPEPGEDVSAMRDTLEDSGIAVLVIDPARSVDEQLAGYGFWKQ